MKIKTFAISLIATLAVSCNNADIDLFDSPAQDAGAGTLQMTQATISSLAFEWQPVDGVHQYGFNLTNADGQSVRQGVTDQTAISFINLERSSEYTLTIEAYGANGHPTLVFALNASTKGTEPLATPDMENAEMTITGNKVEITWPAVENAETYEYELYNLTNSALQAQGTAKTNVVTFRTLKAGEYELKLRANSEDPAYLPSEYATFRFTK